jgi:hypothetical protein
MARKTSTPAPEAEAPVEATSSEENPLQGFLNHQGNALIEAGRAAASLIPEGLRKHGWNAIEESAKGFSLLIGAVGDGVGSVAKTVKDEIILPQEEKSSKVRVNVED